MSRVAHNFIDITGKRFGRYQVLKRVQGKHGKAYWECLCDCGIINNVYGVSLRRGESTSCGCFIKEKLIKRSTKHGMCPRKRVSSEYSIWIGMKARCLNEDSQAFHNYGGRGITICKEWEESFESFYEDMGKRPSKKHSLDRIDNSKGYEKSNCRWTTGEVQARNTRKYTTNTSGFKGVSWYKTTSRWVAYIHHEGKLINLGYFKDIEDAVSVRKEAEIKYWGKSS